MEYTKREEKTLWQGQSLVSGINCRPESVYDDFLSTKLLYHKDDKILFFHMVQSFPKGADVDPVTAHAAAMELGKCFDGREVLVCTHTDRGHVHSHFIINSVSLEDGRKLHISEPELVALRRRNDQVCEMFDLPVFQKGQKKKVKSMSTAEYHAAARGESWKFRLMDTIDECMRYAGTREEFITLMRTEGYDVRWQDFRKNITYTIPDGMKCRDDRLHDERYLKEAMEREFRIRAGIIHGGIEAAELSAGLDDAARADSVDAAGAASDAGRMGGTTSDAELIGAPRGRAGGPRTGAFAEAEDVPDRGADYGIGAGCGGGAGDAATGWEAERAAYLSPAAASAHSTSQPGVAVTPGDPAGALGILTNEKYKGDALLQKKFTVDFLQKKMKTNEGEVPQYYVEGSHPAIIETDEWDQVQAEFVRRKKLGRAYSGKSVLSTKLVCADCGGYYGQKVWHSTDRYRRVIWQCNSKFDNEKRCGTPVLDTDTIQAMFIKAYNHLMEKRPQVIADCELMRRSLTDFNALDAEITRQLEETEVVAEMVKAAVKENASTAQSQDGYLKKYNSLNKRYEDAVSKLEKLKAERTLRQQQDKAMSLFIRTLKKNPLVLDKWDDTIWTVMVEKGIVHRDGHITFVFYNGTEITI